MEITSISLGQINGIYISVCHGVWHTFGWTEGIFTLMGTFPSLHELCRLGARDFFTTCWYLYHYDLAYALRISGKIYWTLISLMPICANLHFVSSNINISGNFINMDCRLFWGACSNGRISACDKP